MKRNAFTLVELLVVISIIGILSSIATVSMSASREKARISAGQQLGAQLDRTISDALNGAWGFDECSGTVFGDSSGKGNNGSFSGAVTFSTTVPLKSGCSLYFNGSSYAVASGQDYPSGITISLWMNTTNISAEQGLFGQNRNGNFINIWMPGNGTIRFETALSNAIYSNKVLAANTWYHIVMAYDPSIATGNAKIYIDGRLDKTGTLAYSAGTAVAGSATIGAFAPATYLFNGYIDDVKIFSSPLLSSEAGKLYAEGKPFHNSLVLR